MSTSAVIVAAATPEFLQPVAGLIGGLSVFKVIETYFADLEKDVPLHAEATYWLTKLRQSDRHS